ncbi:hypothetical protein RIF29_28152 [Crotalaria pallida]|uniref:Vacuolar protein sorting-associated protein Ist1 n=1 Tax=Crotalaria pallida TaxID=3830 RepID=A0AAN9ER46_CROPI
MFEGLFKPKFYTKCKSYAKMTKTRLEVIRKKRNAVQKFLKKDIVDLLRSGLDYNAYGRAEGLLVEQNMTSCYGLITKFIECISDHAKELCKQSECPDECKEAIPSLMYAAARFSDLPELRDLRTLFTDKFHNSLEPYTSKEFVNKLKQEPPSQEMKIQLLRDLAQEFSVNWNHKALEQRLCSKPQLHEEKPKHHPLNDYDDDKWHKNNNVTIPKEGNNERDSLSQFRKNMSDTSWRVHRRSSSDDETSTDNSSQDSQTKPSSSSLGSTSDDEEEENQKPFTYRLVPPPYLIRESNNFKKTTESSSSSNHDDAIHEQVAAEKKPVPKSVRSRRTIRPQPPPDDNATDHSKTDDTEKAVDVLLMHYSKKPPTAPVRGLSLLSEHMTPSKGTSKMRERTNSLVPEMLSTARHVHPSLPDYDDFTARLATLRGR